MKKTILTALIVLPAFAVVPGAFAADEAKKEDAKVAFKQIDADKDGFISRTEAEKLKGLTASFDAADENKDGKLDVAEFGKATATTN